MWQVRIRLDVADLSQLRWAISPAWELLASLRVLGQPGGHAIHMPWLSRHRDDPLLTHPGHQTIRDLAVDTPGPLPGFLAPTPESPLANIDDELAAVGATPGDVVRREVTRSRTRTIPDSLEPLIRAPRSELRTIIADLRRYWQRTIEPSWPMMRGVLERDIHYRAAMLADRGPGEMLNDLHADVHWDPGNQIFTISNRIVEVPNPDRTLVGRGLVLVPSVFAWPRVYVKTAQPWIPVVRYPARGVGVLWEPEQSTHDVSAALGATRARILALIATPSTTDQLARSTGLAPGGVSAQLHRLVTAGLASKARVGREVYYARTARGDNLLA
jgi:DNA-binding transcriptional ArsR family regulator